MTIAEAWAQYAHSLKFSDLPGDVVHIAKRCLLDTLGCGIGGFPSQASTIIQSLIKELGGPAESTVIGSGYKTSCPNATLANGAMVRFLDLNDAHEKQLPMGFEATHPSEVIPSILAVGEREHATGKDILTAIVLGYELSGRWVISVKRTSFESMGWNTDTRGVFVNPAVMGKLLHLDEAQIAQAIGISGTHNMVLGILDASGEMYTMTKNLRYPRTAYGGILSAMLAKKGFTGPVRAMEGNKGFAQTVAPNNLDLEIMAKGDGRFNILDTDVKSHCGDYTMHGHLSATLKIVKEHDLKPEDIAEVRVWASTRDVEHTGDPAKRYPTNKESADHSSYYCQAIAIVDRVVGPDQYSPEKYANPKVKELIGKVVFQVDKDLDRFLCAGIVEIDTKDGKKYRERVEYPLGHYKNPMTDAEIQDKFKMLAKRYMTPGRINKIMDTVNGLEKLEDIREFTKLIGFDIK